MTEVSDAVLSQLSNAHAAAKIDIQAYGKHTIITLLRACID